MPIVNSFIHEDTPQRGTGYRTVVEYHDDHLGQRHRRLYRLPLGADAQASMAAYVADLERILKEDEKEQVARAAEFGRDDQIEQRFATGADHLAAIIKGLMRSGELAQLIPTARRIDQALKRTGKGPLSDAKMSAVRRRVASILAIENELKAIEQDRAEL